MADWKKKESFSTALIQIAVAAAILGGGVYFYVQRGQARKKVADQLTEIHTISERDNPADLDKALKLTQTLLASEPKAGEVNAAAANLEVERWLTYRVAGADAKAREYLAAAQSSGSHSQEGARLLALVADGKAAEAEHSAEELRKQGASSAKLWLGIAEAYRALGNLDLAKQSFTQATDKGWKNPRFFAAQAESLIDEGDYGQAIETANKGLAVNPDHYGCKLALALARARRRDHVKDAADAAKDALDHSAELTPGLVSRALAVSAEVALFEERNDDAIGLAQKALEADLGSPFALWEKARALALKKDPGAAAAFTAAAAARKTAPAIYFDGSKLLTDAGNAAGALDLLSAYENVFKGVTLQTSDGKTLAWLDRDDRFWIARGDVLKASGKLDEAMAAYDKAISVAGINLGKAHFAKGTVFLAKKDYDKAGEELKLVTPEDGTGHLPEAYLAMGETLFAKKDYPTGCQNYAFALARLKGQQAPRQQLNGILEDVNKRLVEAGQGAIAKLWMQEAKPIIQ